MIGRRFLAIACLALASTSFAATPPTLPVAQDAAGNYVLATPVITLNSDNSANGTLPAGTDRSGTATTTSGGLSVAANSSRKGLVGQNISAVNIGFNEQGGTAAIGTAGTYTVPPGATFSVSTNKQVNFIAASGTAAVTMTEW